NIVTADASRRRNGEMDQHGIFHRLIPSIPIDNRNHLYYTVGCWTRRSPFGGEAARGTWGITGRLGADQTQGLIVISCRSLLNPRFAGGPQPAPGREIPVVIAPPGPPVRRAAGTAGAGRASRCP